MKNVGWGERLAAFRKAKGFADRKIWAATLGEGSTTWANYENEKTAPTIETLLKLKERFGLDINEVVTGAPSQPTGINQSFLHTAVLSAMNLIDAAHKSGKEYRPEEATQFILTIYNTMIKETVDGTNSYGQDSALSQPKESENEPNRKAST